MHVKQHDVAASSRNLNSIARLHAVRLPNIAPKVIDRVSYDDLVHNPYTVTIRLKVHRISYEKNDDENHLQSTSDS